MKKNRHGRTRFIKFRVSEADYKKILSAADESSMKSLSDYCRFCIRNPQIFDDEYYRQQLKNIVFQLRKIGNNINQIARNINAGVMEEDTDILIIKLQEILAVLQKIETAVWTLKEHDVYGLVGHGAAVSVREEA